MSSALSHYESFLIRNVSTISSLESTLRGVTWLLPGRFKDAELVSEASPSIPLSPHRSSIYFLPHSVGVSQRPKHVPRHLTRESHRKRAKI